MSSRSKRQWPYFAPHEVVIHDKPEDCWVSLLGKVVDVTPLIEEHAGEKCVRPLLAMAGKDISHWFDETTGEFQHFIHPETGARVPYCPLGPVPDIPLQVPVTDWRPVQNPPWWLDESFQVGLLSKRSRPIRIINMLTSKDVSMNVCAEDTFNRIQDRFKMFNSDADSYTWRYLDTNLDMNKTMEENGILDERDKFADVGLPQNYYTPSVFLFYNDDLKYFDLSDDDDYDIRNCIDFEEKQE